MVPDRGGQPVRGNRKWVAAGAESLADTAAGAGPRGAATGRGSPERGERRFCGCESDRCRPTWDEVSGDAAHLGA